MEQDLHEYAGAKITPRRSRSYSSGFSTDDGLEDQKVRSPRLTQSCGVGGLM